MLVEVEDGFFFKETFKNKVSRFNFDLTILLNLKTWIFPCHICIFALSKSKNLFDDAFLLHT